MRTIALLMVMFAATRVSASEARVVEVRGLVERIGADGEALAVQRGDHVRDGELVRVSNEGQARLLVDEHALVDLGGGAQLRLQTARASGSTSMALLTGRLWARVSQLFDNTTVEVETTNAVAGVRGTSFFAEVDGETTTVSVEAGSVDVASRGGSERALIGASESARVAFGRLERQTIDHTAFETLRTRIASRERRLDPDSETMERLHGAWRRTHDRDGDGPAHDRLRDAIREAYRNRRDNPLDIDPGQARRLLERLRELRELRRAAAARR